MVVGGLCGFREVYVVCVCVFGAGGFKNNIFHKIKMFCRSMSKIVFNWNPWNEINRSVNESHIKKTEK